ncbi:putative ubiquinone biosynthesis methyltransferase [Leishmania infantum JPCM5]|uniref:2-methoxy-6-polyprenyl-1,4-benzoquinol methylase, mitochondrial n=2 Tax=Leishmania infantum TaxID=5671 RepID=A0A6L0Y312_LEIIN|nr:putative ubiquinone biosynthesis methyltransferase [Leishmania infantum JPCM5]CAC9552453.1 ubiquinone_biosynthesis_methyltransferase_-_putative [Leishmania infantum]CAM72454.1 putative ubiquinone biosynthesis methyltransferase [Leishmania infantum JPCM5]SUZ46939.1 ubiquinone_biosynthesis_methyltransferase_-_putative [Leishmania infantum]|eukprot:XP_001469347.1 putative ubiquinone biosynthesis methyltransferase [Leishmania infantum JPCM5]
MLHYTRLGRNMGLGDAYVKKVFDSVATKYDMMNDVLSLGIHRIWKKHFVEDCVCPLPGSKFLDVAGGTGDIAFRITDSIRARGQSFGIVPKTLDGTKVVVCDINAMMLKEGQKRAEREGYMDIDWVCASGEELPFEDGAFDSYTVSFGIRNFSDRPKALREAFRVLKVGGALHVLEFSRVTCPLLSVPYELWSYGFMPQAGRMLADEESYRYLVDSIRAFPDQETFAQMIRDAGFGYVRYENLTGGIACIHTGVKTTPTPITPTTSSDIPAQNTSAATCEVKPEPNSA